MLTHYKINVWGNSISQPRAHKVALILYEPLDSMLHNESL